MPERPINQQLINHRRDLLCNNLPVQNDSFKMMCFKITCWPVLHQPWTIIHQLSTWHFEQVLPWMKQIACTTTGSLLPPHDASLGLPQQTHLALVRFSQLLGFAQLFGEKNYRHYRVYLYIYIQISRYIRIDILLYIVWFHKGCDIHIL